MTFKEAIQNTSEITHCYKSGLQALGANSSKVLVKETRMLTGSVDIDSCLKKLYPNENRWDYVFGYNKQIYYLEVHPATTGEVKKIVEKIKWLTSWIKSSAKNLEDLMKQSSFHWVSSGNTDPAFRKTNKYSRILSQNGLSIPRSKLDIRK